MTFDRRKFTRVMGMTGSAEVGEKLNALDLALRMMAADGLTWEQVLGGGPTGVVEDATYRRLHAESERLRAENSRLRQAMAQERAASPPGWREPRTNAEKIDRCLRHNALLDDWERGFLSNIAGWHGRLTERQQQRLDALVSKTRCAVHLRGAA